MLRYAAFQVTDAVITIQSARGLPPGVTLNISGDVRPETVEAALTQVTQPGQQAQF